MPIPAPQRYIPSNITPQQKAEQLAAVYGVPMSNPQLSEVEIAQMRQILAQHDSERKPMQTIDLNNPPRVPYRYQKFPMMVYDLGSSHAAHEAERVSRSGFVETYHVPAKVVTLLVHSEEQLQAALASGWSEQAPTYGEESDFELSAKYQNEASRVQEQIEAARVRRGPGRPRKDESL